MAPLYLTRDPAVIEELSSCIAALIEKAQAAIQMLQMHQARISDTPDLSKNSDSTSSADAELMVSVASLEGAASSASALAASILNPNQKPPNSGDITAMTATSRQQAGGKASVGKKGAAAAWGGENKNMRLLRSQGYAWVAGLDRSDHCCEWRQSGTVMTFGTGGPWYCVLPRYGALWRNS